jgi:ABC-2 type transport system ATP-binding protein
MLAFNNVNFGYKGKPVLLKDFNLKLPKGKTLLLGPNGSGKSTMMALAAGLLQAKSGTIIPKPSEIAIMPQDVPVVKGLSVQEQVAYVGWLAGLSRNESWRRSEVILQTLNLGNRRSERTGVLSGGELRRVGIASSLMAGNSILLLDEPTAGLDPLQSKHFYASLEEVSVNKCILISSHQISGIGDFFDFVAVVNRGKLLYFGTLSEFRNIGTSQGETEIDEALIRAYSILVEGS